MDEFAEETNSRLIVGDDPRMKFFPAARHFFEASRASREFQRAGYTANTVSCPTNYGGPTCRRHGFSYILN